MYQWITLFGHVCPGHVSHCFSCLDTFTTRCFILDYKTPSNETDLQRFISMVTYLGKFVLNLSNKTGILRQILSSTK